MAVVACFQEAQTEKIREGLNTGCHLCVVPPAFGLELAFDETLQWIGTRF